MNKPSYLRFTPEHEILTDRGWIFFDNLTIGDNVSVLNKKNNTMSYTRLKDIKTHNYNGQLCKTESNQVSFALTPSNSVYVGNYKGTDFKKRLFSDSSGSVCKYLKSCDDVIVNQDNIKEFVLKDGELKSFKALPFNKDDNQIVVPIDLWLSICSIVFYSFILNGNENEDDGIEIVTKNPKIKVNLDKLVKYNLAASERDDDEDDSLVGNQRFPDDSVVCYTITDKTLLRNLDFSKTKTRKWFKKLNREHSRTLLQYLIKENEEKYIKEYTILDINIANDFQILCLHAGYASNIHEKDNVYRIEIIIKKFDKAKVDVSNNKIINYSGEIYEIELEEGDIVYIRKDGKGVWT